ncbi:MAG TPA: phosphatase PAP2 family protein [Candidatus Nanoarchaeia archaeon]|nr:phosphatase PAP2 family protein [Candidatus Nanoarchaeia archaeon]
MNALDIFLFHSIYDLGEKLNLPQFVILFFAEDLAYILLGILLIYILYSSKKHKQKIGIIVSLAVSIIISRYAIVEGFRTFWHRPRPFVELNLFEIVSESSHSFPSAHASIFSAISTVIFFHNRKMGIAFFCTTVVIGLGRILAGVHYPSDIVAGLIVGVISGALGYYSVALLPKKKGF